MTPQERQLLLDIKARLDRIERGDRQTFSKDVDIINRNGITFGKNTTQKLSFYGVTPVIQYATHLNAAAGAAYGANEQDMLNVLRLGLGSYGFFDLT